MYFGMITRTIFVVVQVLLRLVCHLKFPYLASIVLVFEDFFQGKNVLFISFCMIIRIVFWLWLVLARYLFVMNFLLSMNYKVKWHWVYICMMFYLTHVG